ncbi:MAG: hypothetical protein WCG25_03185 [bacterium]
MSIHNEKKEWTVCHHILSAAIHVDHRIKAGVLVSLQKDIISLINVDFHVPALPVRKIQSFVVSKSFRKFIASTLSFRFTKTCLYLC